MFFYINSYECGISLHTHSRKERSENRRSRNASATSAIKRPFAAQIITDASDVRVLFFFHGSRISDCALISAVRLIRDDAFSGISERFITKKVPPSPMAGRCHGRSFFLFSCPPVCRNVFVRPAVSFSGFLPKDGENKAPRADRRKEKRNFLLPSTCIPMWTESRTNLRDIAADRVNL